MSKELSVIFVVRVTGNPILKCSKFYSLELADLEFCEILLMEEDSYYYNLEASRRHLCKMDQVFQFKTSLHLDGHSLQYKALENVLVFVL